MRIAGLDEPLDEQNRTVTGSPLALSESASWDCRQRFFLSFHVMVVFYLIWFSQCIYGGFAVLLSLKKI
jgi:hypothetical protein